MYETPVLHRTISLYAHNTHLCVLYIPQENEQLFLFLQKKIQQDVTVY